MPMEKMSMINVVGLIQDLDAVAREVVLAGSLDVVNALNEINESHFILDVKEENVQTLVDISKVHPISSKEDYRKLIKKIDFLQDVYQQKLSVNRSYIQEKYIFKDCLQELSEIYKEFIVPYEEIKNIQENLNENHELYENFMHMKNLDVEMEKLAEMHYFHYVLGILSKEDVAKLKRNYENIPAIVLHTGTIKKGEIYIAIFPKDLEIEAQRILRSLNFQSVEIPQGLSGTPTEIIEKLENEKRRQEEKLKKVTEKMDVLKKEHRETIEKCYSLLKLQQKVNELKDEMVATNHFFYLSGWIPNREREGFEKRLKQFNHIMIHYKGEEEMNNTFIPPTKLKNNWLFKPFEFLVNMYGMPSYDELDPTPFLGITYMLFFGAMFGDVGQGLVLFLAGWYLMKRNQKVFGQLLHRIGISSMIFGFLYGSFFGFEHVLPALLIVPFENISLILLSAVILGVFLLFISYGYSIANGIRRQNFKEAIFGRNGIVGAMFYGIILLLIAQSFLNFMILPFQMGIVLLILLMALMIVREPLSNLLLKNRPLYHEAPSSYYIESGFEILETLLSMISNTLSFIRVGAFALTHVGLFMAFQVIAGILNSLVGNIIVLTIGNIVIIALEGLIVAIQALRLEYYELFSKYYEGEGREYRPFQI